MVSRLNIGDRVRGWGGIGSVVGIDDDIDLVQVAWDVSPSGVLESELDRLEAPAPGLKDEVQGLINILVATGNDNKRLLSRKVAQLLLNSRGALSRSDKLQAAAMLLVSAGIASQADPEQDDG